MREELVEWVRTYPKQPGYKDGSFAGAAAVKVVEQLVPNAICAAFPNLPGIKVQGSAGDREWTHTPWVALMNRAITTTVQEEYYVVYLLSHGSERLYLTIAQGCTELKNQAGIPAATDELIRRASAMSARLGALPKRLGPLDIELGTKSWRGRLYEHAVVVGVQYDPKALPPEAELCADLAEALSLYQMIYMSGGWSSQTEIMSDGRAESGAKTLEQAKRYRRHRSVERQAGHSREVKRRQGSICKGCDRDMADVYGEVADGVIDAHHLTPLSSLHEGEIARFDPLTDFAVLCPNCHRVIHRLDDPSDLNRLRELVNAYRAAG